MRESQVLRHRNGETLGGGGEEEGIKIGEVRFWEGFGWRFI
jgi:hypothetical protein